MKKEQPPSVFPAVEYEYWAKKAGSSVTPARNLSTIKSLPDPDVWEARCSELDPGRYACLQCNMVKARSDFLEDEAPQAFCRRCRSNYRAATAVAHAAWRSRQDEPEQDLGGCEDPDDGPDLAGVFEYTHTCSTCGKDLPEGEFARVRHGRRSSCKACCAARCKVWRDARKAAMELVWEELTNGCD